MHFQIVVSEQKDQEVGPDDNIWAICVHILNDIET